METMEGTPGTGSGRDVMLRYWEAAEKGDGRTLVTLTHEDFVMEWPQSGERFVGRSNAFRAVSAQDDRPAMEGEPSVIGEGDLWVVRAPLRYADGLYHYVGIFQLREGKLARATEFFAAPFPAKESRATFAERA